MGERVREKRRLMKRKAARTKSGRKMEAVTVQSWWMKDKRRRDRQQLDGQTGRRADSRPLLGVNVLCQRSTDGDSIGRHAGDRATMVLVVPSGRCAFNSSRGGWDWLVLLFQCYGVRSIVLATIIDRWNVLYCGKHVLRSRLKCPVHTIDIGYFVLILEASLMVI